ncbi:MAG: hypothetical protein A3J27_08120, partial [Candidatus Tectomicrobia bacterium RIFCSPLOWO2_12_FULL_69_37]
MSFSPSLREGVGGGNPRDRASPHPYPPPEGEGENPHEPLTFFVPEDFPMPQPPSPFLGFQHIGLKVHDIEAALDFYVGKLGFTVTEIHPPGRVPGVPLGLAFLRCTALHHDLSLFFWPEGECPAPKERTMFRWEPGMHHIALQVGSRRELEAWEAYLKAQGVEIVWQRAIHSPTHPEGDGLWGENHAIYISDPSGNCIEIFCDMG